MAVLMVAICCFIISNYQNGIFSSSEDLGTSVAKVEHKVSDNADGDHENKDHQTFLDVATDAVVVPFASLVAESTMKLIYEIIGFEEQNFQPRAAITPFPSYFLEVLLEQIVAPNAP